MYIVIELFIILWYDEFHRLQIVPERTGVPNYWQAINQGVKEKRTDLMRLQRLGTCTG